MIDTQRGIGGLEVRTKGLARQEDHGGGARPGAGDEALYRQSGAEPESRGGAWGSQARLEDWERSLNSLQALQATERNHHE